MTCNVRYIGSATVRPSEIELLEAVANEFQRFHTLDLRGTCCYMNVTGTLTFLRDFCILMFNVVTF
jgi:hypothetical protein